ncbi:diguanylate cyclase [Crossiella sp. S99.1]|uniref:GGDEF domain-containing protein n=2 Tax=unclassified Crossiella TaxID=2620835 RepID=UPI001FFE763A|nr:GGDEF domain-containing protein [Crossiella sp. S99.1]MCK2239971.1 GGDEF domain-containing protein [Crossiella sp. S99.2]MCK2252679.1 GGDEF domain-containing protein [Crossiella sp. S99.1]
MWLFTIRGRRKTASASPRLDLATANPDGSGTAARMQRDEGTQAGSSVGHEGSAGYALAHTRSWLEKVRDWELWALWRARPAAVLYILAVEALAVALLVLLWRTTGPVTAQQGLVAAVLGVCAVLHTWLGRREEERRRAAQVNRHVDLVEIWWVSAAMLVPSLAIAVIVVLRLQRYLIARRPPMRFLFSTASISVAASLTSLTAQLGGVPEVLASPSSGFPWWSLSVPLCALVAIGSQQLTVAGVVALTETGPRLKDLFGNAADNSAEVVAVSMALVVAALPTGARPLWAAILAVGLLLERLPRLQAEASTDPVTGLVNKRAWQEDAARVYARTGGHSALLMIDLDRFKRINDTYGHVTGDDVLRAVGALLKEHTRPGDVPGRWGGEEFTVLLPETSQREALEVAERLRSAVAGHSVPSSRSRGGSIIVLDDLSVSIGVAVGNTELGLGDVLHSADDAMLGAKEAGRNRVKVALMTRSVAGVGESSES